MRAGTDRRDAVLRDAADDLPCRRQSTWTIGLPATGGHCRPGSPTPAGPAAAGPGGPAAFARASGQPRGRTSACDPRGSVAVGRPSTRDIVGGRRPQRFSAGSPRTLRLPVLAARWSHRAGQRADQAGPAVRSVETWRRARPRGRLSNRPATSRTATRPLGVPPSSGPGGDRFGSALFVPCLPTPCSRPRPSDGPAPRTARPLVVFPGRADLLRPRAQSTPPIRRTQSRWYAGTCARSRRTTYRVPRPVRARIGAPQHAMFRVGGGRHRAGRPGGRTWRRAPTSWSSASPCSVEDVGAYYPHRVTPTPACHSLRVLRVGDSRCGLLRTWPAGACSLPDASLLRVRWHFAVKNAGHSSPCWKTRCGPCSTPAPRSARPATPPA